jgi:protein SCO1/2
MKIASKLKRDDMSNYLNLLFKMPLLLFLIFFATAAAAEPDLELLRKAVETARSAEGNKIADYELTDQDGKKFKLSDYKGKPLLVSFIYTTCPDICNSLVATLVPAFEEIKKGLGDKFNAIVVGFDAEYDTPEMMKEFGLHHETDFGAVRFGSGDKETIARMVKDFGFYYEELDDGGFKHMGLVSILDKSFILYRQIYKSSIAAADIRVPLNQLLTGDIPAKREPTFIDALKSLCLEYDPETGEYRIDYSYILSVVLQALVILIVTLLFFKRDIKNWFSRIFKKKCGDA